MKCKITYFERILHKCKPLPERLHKEATEIIQHESLEMFLDFCIDECFSKEDALILFAEIVRFENYDGNYYEEDEEKKCALYDAVGITEEIFEKYAE